MILTLEQSARMFWSGAWECQMTGRIVGLSLIVCWQSRILWNCPEFTLKTSLLRFPLSCEWPSVIIDRRATKSWSCCLHNFGNKLAANRTWRYLTGIPERGLSIPKQRANLGWSEILLCDGIGNDHHITCTLPFGKCLSLDLIASALYERWFRSTMKFVEIIAERFTAKYTIRACWRSLKNPRCAAHSSRIFPVLIRKWKYN